MNRFLITACSALSLLGAATASGQTFDAPGLWDPRPIDSPVRPPASIGALISAAEARANAHATARGNSRAGEQRLVTGPAGTPILETCSLQVGSVDLGTRGGRAGQTIVANGSVEGTIIQICGR